MPTLEIASIPHINPPSVQKTEKTTLTLIEIEYQEALLLRLSLNNVAPRPIFRCSKSHFPVYPFPFLAFFGAL